MIADRSFDEFGGLLDELAEKLPLFAPSQPLPRADPQLAHDLLSPQALPADPAHMAITAVIDHAIPFAHRLFTTASGHSRIAGIWLQAAPSTRICADIPFGQELRGVDLDALRGLQGGITRNEDAIYRQIGLSDPGNARNRWLIRARSHGAGVACTAAGFRPDDPAGLAHPVIAVGLPDWALADTSGAEMPLLLQASVVYIINRARKLARQISRASGQQVRPPVVINISLGITAGPRDGQSLIEQLQDAIVAGPIPELGQVHFVLATGNSRQQRLNAVLAPGQQIGWQLPPDDRTPSELQIWSAPVPPDAAALNLQVTLPNGDQVTTAFAKPSQPGTQIARLRDGAGRELARLVLQALARGPDRMRQCLTLITPPTVSDQGGRVLAPAGIWRIKLLKGAPGPCDLVIQRDDRLVGFPRAGRQSRLSEPDFRPRDSSGHWPTRDAQPTTAMIRRNGSCNAYAWGQSQIRCGGGYERRGPAPPYAGLLADGAFGDIISQSDRSVARLGVPAPGLRGASTQALSGTSIAAPRATRWLAAKLAQGALLPDRAHVIAAAIADNPSKSGVPRVNPAMPWGKDQP